jgi:hypothetical protein
VTLELIPVPKIDFIISFFREAGNVGLEIAFLNSTDSDKIFEIEFKSFIIFSKFPSLLVNYNNA